MNPTELLEVATALAADTNRKLGASRMTAAALLLRQALEAALDSFWQRSVPSMEHVSRRAQLISLEYFLDPAVARQTVFAWNRLSALCHHQVYELPPTPQEVTHLGAALQILLDATAVRPSESTAVDLRPEHERIGKDVSTSR